MSLNIGGAFWDGTSAKNVVSCFCVKKVAFRSSLCESVRMSETKEIHFTDDKTLLKHLAETLIPLREKPVGSCLFVVEGTLKAPRVGIRYPGRKLKKRELKNPRKNSVLWANLLDFEVVPFENGKEESSKTFTYVNLLSDFEVYKKENRDFWKMIEQVHKDNLINKEPPKLHGINSRRFLEMLKWMWIQEDVNYKLSWKETWFHVPYRLQNKNGGPTSKGAGRDKFYAALLLVHGNHFTATEMRKIIP